MKNKKRLVRVLSIVALCIFSLLAILFVIAAIRQADARKNPPSYAFTGTRVPVGDGEIYVEIGGKEGALPVVFVPGLGDGAYSFCTYAATIADTYRTITYDPAGMGRSDPSSSVNTPDQEIYDLHALLDAMDIDGPYVFVGHSRGGALVRRYAQVFPEEVLGVVLVDATNEEMGQDTVTRLAYQAQGLYYQLLGGLNDVGVPRLISDLGADLLEREIDHALREFRGEDYVDALNEQCFSSSMIATSARQFSTVHAILDEVRQGMKALPMPAYVLYDVPTDDPDSPPEETEEMLRRCIAAVAEQFPLSNSALVYGQGHYLHVSVPDEVTRGIDWVVEQYNRELGENGGAT